LQVLLAHHAVKRLSWLRVQSVYGGDLAARPVPLSGDAKSRTLK
jgi:hypothetical protein